MLYAIFLLCLAIAPSAQTPAVGRLSREARLLFILMWTLVDDSGRLRWQPDAVIEQLYPFDADAPMLMAPGSKNSNARASSSATASTAWNTCAL